MISFPIAWLNFILPFIFEVGNTFALFQITIFHFWFLQLMNMNMPMNQVAFLVGNGLKSKI
jgi:hypothetical protein